MKGLKFMNLKTILILTAIETFSLMTTTAQTKIIAHRGFSGAAPENTLPAFKKAIDIGEDYLELDIHKTKNGKLVVIHDKSVQRTSSNNSHGNIDEMTLKEIKKVKVGYTEKFGLKYRNEKIPTLKKVLTS